ncbi:MAG: ABC transporter ATP-binding protein [Variovorax sp.]|nr:MAG: ABC transporter ATP-binding protein [Variovorax sp.]
MIEIQGVSKSFSFKGNVVQALTPVDLVVPVGSFVSFVGPSGCGKSTLLNMIAGIASPSAGVIRQRGRTVDGINTGVGYMTQQDSLLPWRTAAQNVALPLAIRGEKPAFVDARVADMLRQVGLSDFADHFPSQLSGGMRKRAALAQVLSYDPDTILMDEPFGALDAQLKLVLQAQLLKLWESSSKTIVFVTHDLAEAILLSDIVVVFSGRPGRIKAIKTIDIPRPRDPFQGQFTPAFKDIYMELWNLLAPEISRTAGLEH